MQRLGMRPDPARDFEHPGVPDTHPHLETPSSFTRLPQQWLHIFETAPVKKAAGHNTQTASLFSTIRLVVDTNHDKPDVTFLGGNHQKRILAAIILRASSTRFATSSGVLTAS